MEPSFLIAILSLLLGAIIIFVVFGNYFRNRRSDIDSLSNNNKEIVDSKPASKPQHKKLGSKPHSHAADKCVFELFVSGFSMLEVDISYRVLSMWN
uniref:Uncharacterized protein n=1 Tax=Daucus carota subsp. sativus TaxID=79200 RepID=A0A165A114_DAUCS